MTTWVAPLGSQLDLLVQWLEPILARPGLVRQPAFQIVVGDAAGDAGAIELEPFDALVGPVQISPEGVVAPVIPVEPFLALRDNSRFCSGACKQANYRRRGPVSVAGKVESGSTV